MSARERGEAFVAAFFVALVLGFLLFGGWTP